MLTQQWINLPLTGLAIVVVFFFLPLKKVQGSIKLKLKTLDYSGAILTLAWAVGVETAGTNSYRSLFCSRCPGVELITRGPQQR